MKKIKLTEGTIKTICDIGIITSVALMGYGFGRIDGFHEGFNKGSDCGCEGYRKGAMNYVLGLKDAVTASTDPVALVEEMEFRFDKKVDEGKKKLGSRK